MDNITNDPKVIKWYSMFELSEKTQELYGYSMSMFCNLVGKIPSELISEAVSETKSGLLPSERKSFDYIVQYKQLLKERNFAPKSQISYLAAIKSFYKAFDIVLPASVCLVKKALPLKDNMHFLKIEDVQKLITNAATLRDKAIILLMATSGMARNEVINLRIKDITFEKISDKDEIGIISIRRIKTNVDYITFCSPEAVTAIKAYFDERNRTKVKIKDEDDYVFVELKIKGDDDYIFVDYRFGDKIKPYAFNSIFRREADKLIIYCNGKGKHRKSRSHALRKFFATTLENAGMPKYKVDYLLGHHRSGNDIAYFHVDPELLKRLYIEYLPYITFEKDIHIHSVKSEDEKRLAEVEARNKQLEAQMSDMQAILNEIVTNLKDGKVGSTIGFDRKNSKLVLVK